MVSGYVNLFARKGSIGILFNREKKRGGVGEKEREREKKERVAERQVINTGLDMTGDRQERGPGLGV